MRRQSGGPLYATHRRILGIQNQTAHLCVDFDPTVAANGETLKRPSSSTSAGPSTRGNPRGWMASTLVVGVSAD
jgi:hypothetical protein